MRTEAGCSFLCIITLPINAKLNSLLCSDDWMHLIFNKMCYAHQKEASSKQSWEKKWHVWYLTDNRQIQARFPAMVRDEALALQKPMKHGYCFCVTTTVYQGPSWTMVDTIYPFEMAQWVKVETHMLEGENWLLKGVLWSPCMPRGTYPDPQE